MWLPDLKLALKKMKSKSDLIKPLPLLITKTNVLLSILKTISHTIYIRQAWNKEWAML
jgi:hypothetical protein